MTELPEARDATVSEMAAMEGASCMGLFAANQERVYFYGLSASDVQRGIVVGRSPLDEPISLYIAVTLDDEVRTYMFELAGQVPTLTN